MSFLCLFVANKIHAHGWVGHSESWTELVVVAVAVCSLPKVVIKMTEQTMIAPAMSIRKVKGSPASSQPNNTATAGFTYAYVAARAGDTLRSKKL